MFATLLAPIASHRRIAQNLSLLHCWAGWTNWIQARAWASVSDGKSQEQTGKAGDAQWTPAGTHLPENLSDKPGEGILVELKTK
jgi:hypothetical protein